MSKIEKCHFIGIGGIGMSGLARILLQRSLTVTGSDLNPTSITESLVKLGAKVQQGHSEENLTREMTVVVSTDIKQDNPEYAAAQKLKLPILHRSDLLALLMEGQKGLAVTGTHGKTTTSALLTWVLVQAGLDPSYAIGGWLPALDTNAQAGKGEFFVAEADESDGSFLKYRPFGAIITNIDHDHMNHFGTETKLINAFGKFVKHVTSSKHLFWCGDDALTRKLSPAGISYGFGSHNSIRASQYRQSGWSCSFDIHWDNTHYADIQVALPGRHNALNAMAVFALCKALGLPEQAIREGLTSFTGVKRRCERKYERRGILILDDYAHHPTEIAATLTAIRSAIGERRLIAVFQPHRYTRTKLCMGQFGHIFDDADEILITDIYASNEEPIANLSAQTIVKEIEDNSQVPVRYIPRNSLRTTLTATARPHDVIVTLGAGDITKLGGELAEHYADQSPKRLSIGLICGGMSVEHDVSITSAKQLFPHLKNDCYDVKLFGVNREGKWLFGDDIFDKLSNGQKGSTDTQRGQLISAEILAQIATCDVLLPVLHGTNGEDGTVQGFLEVLGKAYIGCDHRSSAICMDKALTKQIALAAGIPVAPFVAFSFRSWQQNSESLLEEINKTLQWPLYVKPTHLGSSIAIHRVTTPDELQNALEVIFRVDTHAIVESELAMREIEVAIIGNEEPIAFPPGEIFSSGKLHTFAGKYSDSPTPDTEKADLSLELIEESKALAIRVFKAMGCSGLARVDLFLDQENNYWLNEINPFPGCTPNSMFPRLCIANDLPLNELLNRLIILALARRRAIQRLSV